MEEVLAQQRNTAKPMTGRLFVMSMALVLIKLALAQILVNLAISLSGIGLLNIAFYVYAVSMLAGFMRRTVAGSVYVLKESTLTFSKMLGDSATSVVVIPRASVVSIRPVLRGERLGSCYRRVTVIDASATVGWRMRRFGVGSGMRDAGKVMPMKATPPAVAGMTRRRGGMCRACGRFRMSHGAASVSARKGPSADAGRRRGGCLRSWRGTGECDALE